MSFSPDPNVQKIAEAYALDTCDFLKKNFRITLDWTDSSIQQLEPVLETFHKQLPTAKPKPEQIMGFAKMFGSYIGEVYRKNHGAAWGIVEMNDQKFPGLKSTKTGVEFWPWGRVHNRLVQGSENNVWHYYSELIKNDSTSQ
jgi:hypothetical protein